MACGTPVVVSNRSSLPEVVGDAALFVDPEDPASIATAIRRLFTDDALAKTHADRGLARAQLFSWRDGSRRPIRSSSRHGNAKSVKIGVSERGLCPRNDALGGGREE